MARPGAGLPLAVAGGVLIVAGSLTTWVTVEVDLSRLFRLFPADHVQPVAGRSLGSILVTAAGAAVGVAAFAAAIRPRFAPVAGAVVLGAAAGAALWTLFRLARLRAVAVDLVAEASRRPEAFAGAAVTPGAGPFVVLAGVLLALVGGVLIAARGVSAPPSDDG